MKIEALFSFMLGGFAILLVDDLKVHFFYISISILNIFLYTSNNLVVMAILMDE